MPRESRVVLSRQKPQLTGVVMLVELGHTNFQVGPGGKSTLRNLSSEPSPPLEPVENIPEDDGTSVVGWHHDAYPFVAVTMLSDVTNMVCPSLCKRDLASCADIPPARLVVKRPLRRGMEQLPRSVDDSLNFLGKQILTSAF